MSLSPTSYYPFDSDAPSYFKATQISNCLDGERCSSHFTSSTSSEILPPAAFLVSCHFGPKFASWAYSARHCCCTITLRLWTRRYELRDLRLLVITFEIFRSSGSGRLSNTFDPRGCNLISPPRLQWRLPKIIFIVNRYFFTLLLLYVMCTAFLPHIWEWHPLITGSLLFVSNELRMSRTVTWRSL
jgi:hypothetical protein